MRQKLMKIIRGLGLVAALGIILLALLISIGHLFIPKLNESIPIIEAQSSALLKSPVKIQHINLGWNFFEPELVFDNVDILDKKTNQSKLHIQKITMNMAIFRSLFDWKILPESIRISGVHLTLRQPTIGQFSIDELNSTDNESMNVHAILGWVFSQPYLALENVEILYYPPGKDSLLKETEKSITLRKLTLKNNFRIHQLIGEAVFNQDVPTVVRIYVDSKGNIMDLPHLKVEAYMYFEGLSFSQWFRHLSWHQVQVNDGIGSAKIWVTWANNQFQKIQSQFQIYDVSLESVLTHQRQVFPRLSGHVGWRREGVNQIIAGEDILINLPHHLWPTVKFNATFIPNSPNTQRLKDFKINYLDLVDVHQFASTMGLLSPSLEKNLVSLNPRGEIRHVHVDLPNDFETNLTSIPFGLQFSNLSFNPWKKIPGVSHVSGVFDWDSKQGSLILDSKKTELVFNDFFTHPLPFDQLKGLFFWQKKAGVWSLSGTNLQAVNSDLAIQAALTLKIPEGASPEIHFSSDFTLSHLEHIAYYLPLKFLDPSLAEWLRDAFVSGKVEKGKAVIKGQFADFPFDKNNGILLVTGLLKDSELNFASAWPRLQHINGELTFSGNMMSLNVSSAQIYGAPISYLHGTIPYIGPLAPQILNLEGLIKTDFSQSLGFIQHSPLQKTVGRDLAGLELSGPTQLKLTFSIPLRHPDTLTFQGNATLNNANLNLPLWKLKLEQLNGNFQFTEKDILANNLEARLFGQPTIINILTLPTEKTRYIKINLQSILNVVDLQKWSTLPLLQYAKGVTPIDAELHLTSQTQSKPTQILLKTDLKGIEINLPDPFGKKAQDVRHTQLDVTINKNQPIQTKLIYDDLLTVGMNFQKIRDTMKLIDGINLQTTKLDLYGMRLNNPRVQLSKTNNNWLVRINSDQVIGELIIPTQLSYIQGSFQRFHVTNSAVTRLSLINPKSIPAISIRASDVAYNNKQLGNVILMTASAGNGMQIKNLQINSPVANLRASGMWQLNDKTYSTHLQGSLSTRRINEMLNQWGLNTSSLIGSLANAHFDLSWPAAPYDPVMEGLSGYLSFALGQGRIVNLSESTEAKIGLGRMLSIFSLQTIPRRLSLDFSDLFQNGYSFDSLQGNFQINNGDAYTNNTHFQGPVASIDIVGRIGLKSKDYDLKLGVKTYVTGSLISGAAGAVGIVNPIAGVATWVLSSMVNQVNSNSKIGSYQYKIVGPWDNPVWEQVGSGSKS